MRIPIACTLGADDAENRVEEWRRFLESSVDAADPVGAQRLRLRLKPSSLILSAAADLALREKSCCTFFDFSIDVQLDGNWLVIGVPSDAAAVLADFSHLLPGGLMAGGPAA
jgi:hypothetical protein